MSFLTIILFFIYTYGLGFSLAKIAKESENFLERNLMRIGIGLCLLPLIGVLLSALKIPVDWRIFLLISIAYPIYWLARNFRKLKPSFRLTRSDLSIVAVILVFVLAFYMHHKGAFAYPYLEDDDAWSHAIGAKYVAVQKTFFNPESKIHYLDPYPPVYDGILGILSQTSTVYWTLKFFNALLISLSIIFFYMLVKELTDSSAIALFSSVLLAMIPAYQSHFIWAHSLIPGFIFLSFLFLERTKQDKKWVFIAGIAIAALILTTITHSMKFMFMFFIYFAIKSIIEKKFMLDIFLGAVIGILISFIWWVPLAFRYGSLFTLMKMLGLSQNELSFSIEYLNNPIYYGIFIVIIAAVIGLFYLLNKKMAQTQKELLGISIAMAMLVAYAFAYSALDGVGTADRIYDFKDFFIAQKQNMINNPVGIGIAAFSLLFFSIAMVLHEEFSIAKQKINPKKELYTIYTLLIASGIAFIASLISFFSFRFKPGTFLKQWMLLEGSNSQSDYAYVHSFSFKMWGIYVLLASLLLILAIYIYLIYKGHIPKQKAWVAIALGWLVYTFAGMYDIPTQFFTFRLWTLLAVAISMVAAYGFSWILSIGISLKLPKSIIWATFIILIFFTSGMQKYSVNTSIWPPGAFWTSNEEINGYLWMHQNLPKDSRVFTFANNAPIIGFDKFICHWCNDVKSFQKQGFNSTSQDTYGWLKSRKYEYLIVDGQTAKKFGVNETNKKLQDLIASGKFLPAHQTQGFILLKVA